MPILATYRDIVKAQLVSAFTTGADPLLKAVDLRPFTVDPELPFLLERFQPTMNVGIFSIPNMTYDPTIKSDLDGDTSFDMTLNMLFAAVTNSAEHTDGRAEFLFRAVDIWNDEIEPFVFDLESLSFDTDNLQTTQINLYENPNLAAYIFHFTGRIRRGPHVTE